MTPSLPTFSIASAMMLADGLVAVGRDRADLGDLLLALGGLRELLELSTTMATDGVDAALEVHRVVAGGDQLRPR
jgi:hypothetical protein